MKVLFEFSRSGLPRCLPAFEKIRDTILQKHTLTNDLLKDTKNNRYRNFSKKIFNIVNKAINRADCIVIEGSAISLAVSYVLTQSINLGKPVLFLTHSQSSESDRNRFVNIIDSKLLSIASYSSIKELPKIIDDFIDKSKFIKTRFNLVIPNDIYGFISVGSNKLAISKTKFILKIIRQYMTAKQN